MLAFARPIVGFCVVACVLAAVAPRVQAFRAARAAPEVKPAERLPRPQLANVALSTILTGVEITADRTGHYRTEVRIDGFSVPVLVDTGATLLSLSASDAQRIGLHLTDADYRYRTETANGTAAIALVTLHEVQLGNIRLQDVKASVSRGSGLSTSLLGMSFLGRLSKIEAGNGRLVLRP